MTITVGNIGAVSHTVNNTDVTPVLPSHISGDLLLGFASQRCPSAISATLTASAGWTKLLEWTARGMVVWAKVAASGSESNPTFTTDTQNTTDPWSAFAMVVKGTSTNLGAIVETVSSGLTGAGTVVTFDGLTITTNGVILFDFASITNDRTVTPTPSPAYTGTIGEDGKTTLGDDATIYVQYRIQTIAESTATHTGAATSNNHNTLSFALIPASGSIAPQAMSLRRFMGIS